MEGRGRGRGRGGRENENRGMDDNDDQALFVFCCFLAWLLLAALFTALYNALWILFPLACLWLALYIALYKALLFHFAGLGLPINTLLPSTLRVEQTSWPNGGLPLPFIGSTDDDGTWCDVDIALARGTAPDHLVIPVNIDPTGEFNVSVAEQLPEEQAPLQYIDDIDPIDPAEADLALLLVQGEVVGLLRQIERGDESLVRRCQVPQPIAEEDSVPLSLVPDRSVGVSQNLLILPAVQQALVPAVEAVQSASREVESAVIQVQDEANTVRCPQVPRPSTSEGALVPPDLVGSVTVRGSQHLPTVLQVSVAVDTLEDCIDAVDALAPEILAEEASEHGIIPVDTLEVEITGTDGLKPAIGAAGINAFDALDLPQEIDGDEANTNSLELNKDEDEVHEASVQPILQLASGDPRHPRVATASLSIPAGDLSSHLEERMPPDTTKESVTEAVAYLLKDVEYLEGEPEVMGSG